MSEALVPVVDRREIARPGATTVALPEVIVDAGPAAVERFLEFSRPRSRTTGRGRPTGRRRGGSWRGAGLEAWGCGRSRRSTWRPTSGRIPGRRQR